MLGGFNYKSSEHIMKGGTKTVRTVSIKNGRGYKSVTKYRKGEKIGTVKKHIHAEHIKLIQSRKFIPRLFADVIKQHTRSNKR